jgi:hypothetical protein
VEEASFGGFTSQRILPMAEVVGNNANDTEVFIYTGEGGSVVPQDVVRVRVDPSVTSIPDYAFHLRKKLTEVELCEGLVEIGLHSFSWCDHSITTINIPNSLRRIEDLAFYRSLRTPIRLHDGIESIRRCAFAGCIFTNFRVPPLITMIPDQMIETCESMFSVELSKNVREIGNYAFGRCFCLRNVAIPQNAVIGNNVFVDEYYVEAITDLQRLFGDSNAEIIWELQHRFDGLPIHSIVYYQSYNQGVLQILIAAINMRSGQRRLLRPKQNPTGNQQDCLGMTPLHILACSSVHDLELYCVIVENYPANLITEDGWGAIPLLYAFWGAAPMEIIEFLLESYQSLYPGYEFNWTNMVETMGRTETPKENFENLLCVKQMHFPEQPLDWEYLLDKFASNFYVSFDEFAQPSQFSISGVPFQERMKFLFKCGLSDRVKALAFKLWRDHITNMIQTSNFQYTGDNLDILREIRAKLAHFEDELQKLKEVTPILELAIWKIKMNEKKTQDVATQSQKKIKTDKSSARQQCRVTCGADIIISNVLPYIISG